MQRAVFLDRDGVINAMVYNPDFGLVDSPANPDQFELLPGVGEAVCALNQMGFLVIVVSNQPGIAKGKLTLPLLQATTDKMRYALAQVGAHLDSVYYCLHHPAAVLEEYRVTCDCRKPKPGLLLKAAQEWDIDLNSSYMVGDGITDMCAGQAAGTTTLFVSSRKFYIWEELARQGVQPDYVVCDLPGAVGAIDKIEAGDRSSLVDCYPPTIVSSGTAYETMNQ